MKKIILFLCFAIAGMVSVNAQNNIDQLIKGSVSDANLLVEGYTAPMLRAFGYGLNQGWYNTAKPHKIAGIDITLMVSKVNIPNADLFYNPTLST